MLNLSPFLLLQQWTSFSPTVFPSLLDCFHKAQIFCNFCCLKIFLWPHVPLKPQPPFLFLWNSFCICSFNACPPFLLGTHYYQIFPPFLGCNFSCHCPQWSPRSKTQWSVLDPYFTRPTCRIWHNHSRLHETVSLCASQVLQSPGFSPGFSIFFFNWHFVTSIPSNHWNTPGFDPVLFFIPWWSYSVSWLKYQTHVNFV